MYAGMHLLLAGDGALSQAPPCDRDHGVAEPVFTAIVCGVKPCRIALAARTLALLAATAASAQAALWVSPDGNDRNPGTEEEPVRTIARARDLVRGLNRDMADDVTVFIAGSHHLDAPVEFGPEDSATNGFSIIYTAAPGEHPVITGGYAVQGWTIDTANHALWVAPAPAGLVQSRNLFVNGTPVRRTSGRLLQVFSRNPGPNQAGQAESAGQWKNFPDVAFEAPAPDAIWSERGGTAPAFVRNAFEFLGTPGEWYFDRPARRIYYTPRPGEKVASAIVEAAAGQGLITLKGEPGKPITGLIFKGLRFDYAGRPDVPRAAVRVSNAQSIQFMEDEFLHMDCPGLELERVTETSVEACLFADITGSAIRVNGSSQVRILESRLSYTSVEHGAEGSIDLDGSQDVTIEHDQIDHFPLLAIQRSGASSASILEDLNIISPPMIAFHGTPAEPVSGPQADAGVPAAYQSLLDEEVGAATVPQPPEAVSAEPEDQFAYVTWLPSCQDGGSPVTGYTVTSSVGAKATISSEDFEAKGYVVMGDIDNGSFVTFTVAATNALGSSPPSMPTATVKPLRKRKLRAPGPPAALSVTTGASGVRVKITPPASDGGSPVVSYLVSSGADGERDALEGLDVIRADAAHPVLRRIDGSALARAASISVSATNASGEGDPAVVNLK
jgi:hypothetical protein